jgi:hypothetical protein
MATPQNEVDSGGGDRRAGHCLPDADRAGKPPPPAPVTIRTPWSAAHNTVTHGPCSVSRPHKMRMPLTSLCSKFILCPVAGS